jgi:glycosyltransferase involved in cell wall biosynthesis
MKIINVIPTISISADGVGGFVRRYSQALDRYGIENEIFSQDPEDTKFRDRVFTHKCLFGRTKYMFSLGLFWRIFLRSFIDANAFFHFHGLWMWHNLIPLFVPRINFVYSTHGSITPNFLNNISFYRAIYFKYVQKQVLNRARVVLATSEMEKHNLIEAGIEATRISVLPLFNDETVDNLLDKVARTKQVRRFIFVGRLAPIKNLELVLDTFTDDLFSECSLLIVGPLCDPYSIALEQKYSRFDNICFSGAKTTDLVKDVLRDADCLLLPSFSENFSFAALEAIQSGCRLIVSSKTPWSELAASFVLFEFDPVSQNEFSEKLAEVINYSTTRQIDPGELKKFTGHAFILGLLARLEVSHRG